MKLILIGIPGAGKSTQGNLLSRQLKIPYLSTGHIFREIAKEKTKLGRCVKETMNAGILIPDNKTIDIVNNYLSQAQYKNGYILDGFPRTIRQAERFVNNIDKVIYLKIPEKEALWRLVYRNDKSRGDETLPALKKRIELFHKFTEPVLNYYQQQGKMLMVDGTNTVQEVNEEILKSIGKQLIRNQIKVWQKKQKSIIALVGLPGAGKTDAANYFRKKGLPVITFGEIVKRYLDERKLKHTEENHKKIREGLRDKYGEAALAILNENLIKEALNKATIMIIDGLRSWEEYLFLKKKFPKVNVYILAIYADKQMRYARIIKRSHRPDLYGERRDINELVGINMGPTFAFADFLIKNNFYLNDFYDKLDEIYRIVYFS